MENTKEIRQYINLMESINKLIDEKPIINEANPIGEFAREGKIIAKELEPVFNIMKTDAKINPLLLKVGVKDSEGMLNLIKNDFKSIDNLSTKVPKLLPAEAKQLRGAFELNILKSSTTNKKLLNIAAENLVKNQRFLETYKAYGNDTDFINELKKNKYSDQGAKAIAEKRNALKTGGLKPPVPKPSVPKKWWDELIPRLKQKMSWKKLLLWGAGLGITSAVLWNMISSSGEAVPDDFPPQPPVDTEWMPCIQNLLNNKQGKLVSFSDGTYGVQVISSEYPKGLQFMSNGRVYDIATGKKGSYKCKSGKTQLSEQINDELSNDVETMIDLLDFPVTQNDLIEAGSLLKKYVDNGRGKEFLSLYQQSGLGGGSLNKTINYIYTANAKSVQAKNYLKNLVSQIQSGKSTTTDKTTTGGGSLDDILITWDGDKTQGGGGGKTPRKSIYHDCSKKDFPLEFGCKSSKIREIQRCLGMETRYQTGNFGPITLRALSNGGYDVKSKTITSEIYTNVTTNCKGQKDLKMVGTDRRDTDLKPTAPTITPKEPRMTSLESPEQLYKKIYDAGLLTGEDGGNRIKYKGDDLSPESLEKLDTALSNKGYTRIKQKDKEYGEKYVWVKTS